ncbi:heavy-metal-associated domain-containing protein [Mucilaginibacter sp. KACC 22063]|uniref:heavy-metal-associated domain-containing protein n=1 Tax=Mucilaginibacter sp. KACC 22063 TaxID=3025666 RepID=UPI002365E579|nr:heavy metal transport/detoxification protein [Mucilaginibacter sp. KACC 22063]WDF55608.1 heavy metal transport/detoxification protein [Mucilaginibacter sp. KACC 22063]
MGTIKFKTNINCGGCIAKVTPALNEAVGEGNWQVETGVPEKILTVESNVTLDEIVSKVQAAGFKIEQL